MQGVTETDYIFFYNLGANTITPVCLCVIYVDRAVKTSLSVSSILFSWVEGAGSCETSGMEVTRL